METGLFWKEEPPNRPWNYINHTDIQQAIAAGAMFATWTRYSFEPGNGAEPIRFGNLPLDFDDAANPQKALDDLRHLCTVHLPEMFNIDPNAIKFFVSGNKGFHAVIPDFIIGSEAGHEKLPLIYKRLVAEWREDLSLSSLDMSLYCMGKGKMFRIAGRRRENGRYKAPISLNEILTFKIDRLMDLSTAPRRIDPVDVDRAPCAYLNDAFRMATTAVENDVTPTAEPMSPEEIKRLAETTPPCIEEILSELPPTTEKLNYNRLCMLLANFYQDTGVTFEQAIKSCSRLIDKYPHSQSYDTPAKRAAEFAKVWKHMIDEFGYFFSCERAKALGLRFDCLRCAKDGSPVFEVRPEPVEELLESPVTDTYGFPEHVMTGAAGTFSKLFAEKVETPIHFLFISYLTCLGSQFAHKLSVDSELKTQARFYALLVGESATERKSTAIEKVTGVFTNVFPDFKSRWGLGSAEGLQNFYKKKADGPFINDRFGVLLCFDEFKSFVSKCQITTSVLLPVINTLFEKNNYETHTKNSSIILNDVNISLLAATTRETYDRLYDGNFLDIGFPNRVFIVPGHAEKRFSIPQKLSSENYTTIHADLFGLKHFVGNGVEFNFTEGAKKIYHSWYMNLESSIHSKRLDTYSLRLMQLLALNQEKRTIDAQVIKDAIDICNWQLVMRQQFDPISADTRSAEIEQRIVRQLAKGPQTDRELRRAIHAARVGLWFYGNALTALKAAGDIVYDTKNKKWHLAPSGTTFAPPQNKG